MNIDDVLKSFLTAHNAEYPEITLIHTGVDFSQAHVCSLSIALESEERPINAGKCVYQPVEQDIILTVIVRLTRMANGKTVELAEDVAKAEAKTTALKVFKALRKDTWLSDTSVVTCVFKIIRQGLDIDPFKLAYAQIPMTVKYFRSES
jgi:hypothetical protein